jgi:Flp pilus assembly protein TadG
MKRRRGRSRTCRGNALIEFALSFTFLFSALAGAFQFGYSYELYNTLESAVRDAARYASLRAYDSSTTTPSSAFLAAVQNMAVYGDPAGGGQPVATGLAPAKITVTVVYDHGAPYQVTVSVVNYTIDAVFAIFTLNGKPAATFPYLGRYAPPT